MPDPRARLVYYGNGLTGEEAIRIYKWSPAHAGIVCSATIGTLPRLDHSIQALFHFCYGATVSSAALVGAIAKVYTPEVGVTVGVERVPWIVPSVDPSKVCPP
jgi:hypothetical protein